MSYEEWVGFLKDINAGKYDTPERGALDWWKHVLYGTDFHPEDSNNATNVIQQINSQSHLPWIPGDDPLETHKAIVDNMANYEPAKRRMQLQLGKSMLTRLKHGVTRQLARGGVGVLTDALATDHKNGYDVSDNVTAGAGGIAGGLLGTMLARKLSGGSNVIGAVGNVAGSALGGWGLNNLRRSILS